MRDVEERLYLARVLRLSVGLGIAIAAAFGIGWTFSFMAPMLGVTFKLSASRMAYGVLLLAVYGVGHCSVIVLAGTSTELVQRNLNRNGKSKMRYFLVNFSNFDSDGAASWTSPLSSASSTLLSS